MPRQQINLEPYRDEIITLFQHGISSDSIGRTLESRYNIQVKERTIQSRLRKWGIRKRHRTTTADETLHARIKMLFVQDRLTDKAMLKLLRSDGWDISERTLRRLRFQLGLHARTSMDQHAGPERLFLVANSTEMHNSQRRLAIACYVVEFAKGSPGLSTHKLSSNTVHQNASPPPATSTIPDLTP